jgi:polyhydroxyalkanoate synthesis regulator phasin
MELRSDPQEKATKMAKKGFSEKVKERGMEIGMKLMNDPKNQQRFMKAMDALQKGKAQLEELSEQVLHLYGLPSQKDIKALGKRLTQLKKQAADIKQRLQNA